MFVTSSFSIWRCTYLVISLKLPSVPKGFSPELELRFKTAMQIPGGNFNESGKEGEKKK